MTHREDRTDDHFASIIVNTAVQKCDCAFSCDRLIERLAQQWPNYPDFIDNFIPRFVAEENQNMVRDFLRLEEMTGRRVYEGEAAIHRRGGGGRYPNGSGGSLRPV